MSRGITCVATAAAFVLALAVMAVSATACEGGGGGPELTALSTKLSGESKEGEELTVLEGAKVKDKATLTGANASKATGKVTYKVYSDKECKTLVTSAGEVTVSGESVPASSEETLEGGKTYYWQAHYGGDSNNSESTSPCTEVLNVKAKTSISMVLSGEGSEGEEITIIEGSKALGKATLSGTNFSTAGGNAVYNVYSDGKCETLVTGAGEVAVTSGVVPASTEKELEGGKTYLWQVAYKGDGLHQESKSTCDKANLKVKKVNCTLPYCEPTITPGALLDTGPSICTAGPVMVKGAERFLLTAGHCFWTTDEETETTEQVVSSAYPADKVLKEIGKTVTVSNADGGNDTAEVKIESATWQLKGGGVPPYLVEWEATPNVTAVLGKAANKIGEETCFSGSVSGAVHCGTIVGTKGTRKGTVNLIETTATGSKGDSGGPEFVRTKGGVLIQGTVVGIGAQTFEGPGTLTKGGNKITMFPAGEEGDTTCEEMTKMESIWAHVPAQGTGIPASTNVSNCTEANSKASLEMSANATAGGSGILITVGYKVLSWYEPITQIESVFGQTLLVK